MLKGVKSSKPEREQAGSCPDNHDPGLFY